MQNRVVDIRRNVNPNSWFYCRTYDKSADIITRFKMLESLEPLHMWGNGRCFLKSSNDSNNQIVDKYDLNIDLFHQEVLC